MLPLATSHSASSVSREKDIRPKAIVSSRGLLALCWRGKTGAPVEKERGFRPTLPEINTTCPRCHSLPLFVSRFHWP